MNLDVVPAKLARLVPSRAIRLYAKAIGWQPIEGVNGDIALFHRPDSELHQLLVPLDEDFDDYSERVSEAITKLAAYERRPVSEVLDHLLLPPADVLRVRDSSPDTQAGSLSFEQAVSLLNGTRKLLLAQAHSILQPKQYHPRLSRSEATRFVEHCRLGQTERGSFTITVACPLDTVPGTLFKTEPFARQVTLGLFTTLDALAKAADSGTVDDMLDAQRRNAISANFCDALLMLRPSGDRSFLSVSSTWSKTIPFPDGLGPSAVVELRQECFEAAEYLAPKLREMPEPKPASFVGFVSELHGEPSDDGRPFGEVVFSIITEDGETVSARAQLTVEEYAIAGAAHLAGDPVFFTAHLLRMPRRSRLDDVQGFIRLEQSAVERGSEAVVDLMR